MKRSPLERRTPLARGSKGLARTELKRGRPRKLTGTDKRAAAVFKASVMGQPCAVCGTEWAEPDAHHVLPKQLLKRLGLPLWDPRNSLPLCPIGSTDFRCHERHETGARKIPRLALRECNLDYVSEVLGERAGRWLARYYG